MSNDYKIHGHAVLDGLEFVNNSATQANTQYCLTVWDGPLIDTDEFRQALTYNTAGLPFIQKSSIASSMAANGSTLLAAIDVPRATYLARFERTDDQYVQTFPTSLMPAQTAVGTGTATQFILMACNLSAVTNIYGQAVNISHVITGSISDQESSDADMIVTTASITAGQVVVLDDLVFKFPVAWNAVAASEDPEPYDLSDKLIVEVIGKIGEYACIGELKFLTAQGQTIPYTTTATDVFQDGGSSSVPYYWTDSTHGRLKLNNGLWSDHGHGTVFSYGTEVRATRFLVTFTDPTSVDKIVNIELHSSTNGTGARHANEINIYRLTGSYLPRYLQKLDIRSTELVAQWKRTDVIPGWKSIERVLTDNSRINTQSIKTTVIVEVHSTERTDAHTVIQELELYSESGSLIDYSVLPDWYNDKVSTNTYWSATSGQYRRALLNDGNIGTGAEANLAAMIVEASPEAANSITRFALSLSEHGGATVRRARVYFNNGATRPASVVLYSTLGTYDSSMLENIEQPSIFEIASVHNINNTMTDSYASFAFNWSAENVPAKNVYIVEIEKLGNAEKISVGELELCTATGLRLQCEVLGAYDTASGQSPDVDSMRRLTDRQHIHTLDACQGTGVQYLRVAMQLLDSVAGTAVLSRKEQHGMSNIRLFSVTGEYDASMLSDAQHNGMTLHSEKQVVSAGWTVTGTLPDRPYTSAVGMTQDIIVEVEGDLASAGHVYVLELEFYDSDARLVTYTTTATDAYDETVGGVPSNWNTADRSRAGLQDGRRTYVAGSYVLLMYQSGQAAQVVDKRCRFLVHFDSAEQAQDIAAVALTINGTYRPRHAWIWAVDEEYEYVKHCVSPSTGLRLLAYYENLIGYAAGVQTVLLNMQGQIPVLPLSERITTDVILEAEGDDLSSAHVYINELEFFDAYNILVPYTTTATDKYYENVSGVDSDWNASGLGRIRLNDGNKTYGSGSTCRFFRAYPNSVAGHRARARLVFAPEDAERVVRCAVTIHSTYRPRFVRIYKMSQDTTYDYDLHCVQRPEQSQLPLWAYHDTIITNAPAGAAVTVPLVSVYSGG